MEKTLSYETPKEHYAADACVVWCYDDRFSGLLGALTKDLKNYDLVKVAGGAKALAGDPSPERDFVLAQVTTSIRLHGAKRVVLMLHRDCGAYGGSKQFADPDAEAAFFKDQLAGARDFLKGEVGDLPVDAYFADFDGLFLLN